MRLDPASLRKLGHRGRGRSRHIPGVMNKLERAYSGHLDALVHSGEVLWWAFEPCKLKLADRTYYTPDFLVMLNSHLLEFVDIKGSFQEDDARVKVKVAAKLYAHLFDFVFVTAKSTKARGLEILKVERFNCTEVEDAGVVSQAG